MQKRLLFIITSLLIVMALAGCSSQEEDEVIAFQNDYKENVADPIANMAILADEKEVQLESGEIDDQQFVLFLEDEFLPSVTEKRTYITDYPALETDIAQDYKELLDDNALTTINFLEENAEFLLAILTDDGLSEDEVMERMDIMEELLDEVIEKDEAVIERQEELEEEHNIEFHDDEE